MMNLELIKAYTELTAGNTLVFITDEQDVQSYEVVYEEIVDHQKIVNEMLIHDILSYKILPTGTPYMVSRGSIHTGNISFAGEL